MNPTQTGDRCFYKKCELLDIWQLFLPLFLHYGDLLSVFTHLAV